jgi:hypothetical protein
VYHGVVNTLKKGDKMKDNKSTNTKVKITGETKCFEIVDSENSETPKKIFSAQISSSGAIESLEVFDDEGVKIRDLSYITSVGEFQYFFNILKTADKEISNLMKTFVVGK